MSETQEPGKELMSMNRAPDSLCRTIIEAIEYAHDGLAIIELDGKIIHYNRAIIDIHALDPSVDYHGKNFIEIQREEIRPMAVRWRESALRDGCARAEFGTVRRDGKYHVVQFEVQVIRELTPPVAVIAMREVTELVLAREELERRNRDLSVMNDIYQLMALGLDREKTIHRLLELLADYAGSTHIGLYRNDRSKGSSTLVGALGVSAEVKKHYNYIDLKDSVMQKLIDETAAVVIEDDYQGVERVRQGILNDLGIHKTIALTLRSREPISYTTIIGIKRRESVSPELRNFYTSLGSHVGFAIERLELFDTIRKHEEELKRLTARLVESSEQEKRQMAALLHDEIGQSLIALKFELGALEKAVGEKDSCVSRSFETVRTLLDEVASGTKRSSLSLHPAMLEDVGLVATLHWYVEQFVEREGLSVELEAEGFDEDPALFVATNLYRVAQECLTNIVRHAGASNVKIMLTKGYPHVIMRIEDNGKGFSPSLVKRKSRKQGLGLIDMRERVERLGGSFELKSTRGKGTVVRVKLPLEVGDGHKAAAPSRRKS